MFRSEMDQAINALRQIIESGCLRSTVDPYLDGLRVGDEGFYPKLLTSKGREYAEAELEKYAQKHHLRTFAGLVEPVAVGLLKYLEASREKGRAVCCSVRTASADEKVLLMYKGTIVSVALLPPSVQGRRAPKDTDLFVHRLLISAIAINNGCMVLFMPPSEESKGADAFRQIYIGSADGVPYGDEPELYHKTDGYLWTTLGLCDPEDTQAPCLRRGLETVLPSPDPAMSTKAYLARYLLHLPRYLSDLHLDPKRGFLEYVAENLPGWARCFTEAASPPGA